MTAKGPSATTLEMAKCAKETAQAEVDEHLADGRPVYGRDQQGNPIVVHMSRLELAQQVMDWEGPARP